MFSPQGEQEPPTAPLATPDLLKPIKAVLNAFETHREPLDAQVTNFNTNIGLMKNPVPPHLSGSAKTRTIAPKRFLARIHEKFGPDACIAHCLGYSKTGLYNIRAPNYDQMFEEWWIGLTKPAIFLSWSQSKQGIPSMHHAGDQQAKIVDSENPGPPDSAQDTERDIDDSNCESHGNEVQRGDMINGLNPRKRHLEEEAVSQRAKRADRGNRYGSDAENIQQRQIETKVHNIAEPGCESDRAGVFWRGDMSNGPTLGPTYTIGQLKTIETIAKIPDDPKGTMIFPNDQSMSPFIMIKVPEDIARNIAQDSLEPIA